MTPPAEWRPRANPYVIGGSVALATFMQVLDTTIVSVAMPHMAGSLSATCSLTISKRILNAPGSLHLKGLAFDHSSTKGTLLGVPAWALVTFLSDNRDELTVPFTVNGSLDNPRFSAHQSLVDQVATALSSKIGVPTVSNVGKGIMGIGEKGLKGIFGITGNKK